MTVMVKLTKVSRKPAPPSADPDNKFAALVSGEPAPQPIPKPRLATTKTTTAMAKSMKVSSNPATPALVVPKMATAIPVKGFVRPVHQLVQRDSGAHVKAPSNPVRRPVTVRMMTVTVPSTKVFVKIAPTNVGRVKTSAPTENGRVVTHPNLLLRHVMGKTTTVTDKSTMVRSKTVAANVEVGRSSVVLVNGPRVSRPNLNQRSVMEKTMIATDKSITRHLAPVRLSVSPESVCPPVTTVSAQKDSSVSTASVKVMLAQL